jgi:DNA primase
MILENITMSTLNKYTAEELEKARGVRIQDLLGTRNKRTMVKCPFHNDNSPSLLIDENNGFYCFGCNATGNNAIDFVVKLGYSFPEAIEELLNNW